MIRFLLLELEKNTYPLFTRKELLKISTKDFQELTKKKILVYYWPSEREMERISLPRCQHGCNLTVIPVEDGLEAVCLDHPEEDPVPIDREDLNRYTFSIDRFLSLIRTANRIEGKLQPIEGRYFYIGYKIYSDVRVGFIFIHNIAGEKLVGLSGLKQLYSDDAILVVLTPVSVVEDIALTHTLKAEGIVQASLSALLDSQTFELPIEKLISNQLVKRTSKKGLPTELSPRQKKDYDQFEYQCYDKINIPGGIPMKRSNVVIVNGIEVKLGDYLFILFLRFVVELKKKKGGWINIHTLKEEGIIGDSSRYQIYSNLRTTLAGSLHNKDGKKFIQSDGSKEYRISVHPDFITYDKKKLRKHIDSRIGNIAKNLP